MIIDRERERESRKSNVPVVFSGIKEEQAASLCQLRPPGPAPRCRHRRRRLIYKVAPLTVSSTRRAALTPLEASPLIATAAESVQEECEKEQESAAPSSDQVSSGLSVLPPESNPVPVNNTANPHLNPLMEPQLLEVM